MWIIFSKGRWSTILCPRMAWQIIYNLFMWCIKKGYKEHIKWKWTLSSHSFCWYVANFWPNTNLVKCLLHIPIYGFANILNWLVGKSHCCKNLIWRIWACQCACCFLPSNTLTIVTLVYLAFGLSLIVTRRWYEGFELD
jgi:hypothetical protein